MRSMPEAEGTSVPDFVGTDVLRRECASVHHRAEASGQERQFKGFPAQIGEFDAPRRDAQKTECAA